MSDILAGRHFEVITQGLIVFEARGFVIREDRWAFNVGGDEWCSDIEPTPISPTVRTCIEMDQAEGKADRIAQLHLSPKSTVMYYLEGQLTYDHFLDATEDDYSIRCLTPVRVLDYDLQVVITPHMELDVATADADGRLL